MGVVGKSVNRVDAYDKVTGRAMYTEDLCPDNALTAVVMHAEIANGVVKSFDLKEALAVPGVIKILTCLDIPDLPYETGTHPWILDGPFKAVEDRRILNKRIRYYGDEIAAVVAVDELTARAAVKKIKVEYEVYPAVFDVLEAAKPGAPTVNELFPDNIMAKTDYEEGGYDEVIKEEGLTVVEGWYETPAVKHCQIEVTSGFAYMRDGCLNVYSATQTIHAMRRVIGQATGFPWGKVRIIKPCVGGGFGNKEDTLFEPLNAYLCLQLGGRCIRMAATREEDFVNTRVRHNLVYHLTTHVRPDGTIAARRMESFSNKGAYCHHGHAIAAKGSAAFRMMYKADAKKAELSTVLTNTPVSGAMRGYGAPQAVFAVEANMEDICHNMHLDPIAFRKKNLPEVGYEEEDLCLINYYDSLNQCLDKGREMIDYDRKYREYQNQTGPVRKGIGVSTFWYNTAAWPALVEASNIRFSLNQDGSVGFATAEVEIGQGSDTALTQMAADALHLPLEAVHFIHEQDTDFVGRSSGAYASRQTYVGGEAIYETAALFREKVLDRAAKMLKVSPASLEIENGEIVSSEDGRQLLTMQDVAMDAYYNFEDQDVITAEKTVQLRTNALSLGCCFADLEVDLTTGRITVKELINVHDCGKLINPQLAEVQVLGGMSMGLGYALSEKIKIDPETGRVLNNNLLDYKLPGSMDHPPKMRAAFIENPEPTSHFGVKGLGEPPVCPVAPAIRNAVLNATGVMFNSLPLDPETCCRRFHEEGLI